MKNDNLVEIILAILIGLSTGLNGLISYCFLATFSKLEFGRDNYATHGLVSGSSRLGGIAIIFNMLVGTIINLYLIQKLSLQSFFSEMMGHIVFFSLLISLIGLTEDISQKLSSMKRLVFITFLVALSLLFMDDILPSKLSFFGLYDLKLSPIIFIISVVMTVGFVNAGNMADGANGLFALISTFFFIMLYSQYETISYLTLIVGLISFSLYNIITGKIFLGDCGSYFLSSLIAFSSLKAHLELNLPIFLFASFLIYPCFEIVKSIYLRLVSKAPIMSPDNMHLHNYVNDYYLSLGLKNHASNSMTGISIAVISSLPALYSFFILRTFDGNYWLLLFICEFLVLILFYEFISKAFKKNEINIAQ